MNANRSQTRAWRARLSTRPLGVAASLALAALGVVLAYGMAIAPATDKAPPAGSISYIDRLGEVLAGESMAPVVPEKQLPVTGAPAAIQRDPSVPDITFVPNAADAEEPRAPTF